MTLKADFFMYLAIYILKQDLLKVLKFDLLKKPLISYILWKSEVF